jgi:hypothetical protein
LKRAMAVGESAGRDGSGTGLLIEIKASTIDLA